MMNRKSAAYISQKQPNRFFDFLRISGNNKLDRAILGIAAIIILTLLYIGVRAWSRADQKIQYTPADVVYGQVIRAVHGLDTENNSRTAHPVASATGGEPSIRISEKFHDFGKVNSGLVLTRTFVIANTGQSPLVIQRAYTTCGCTVADFTTAEIPPGKVALMTLQFDTAYHDMRGTTVRRGVMIETNDPGHPTQEVWIQASIR